MPSGPYLRVDGVRVSVPCSHRRVLGTATVPVAPVPAGRIGAAILEFLDTPPSEKILEAQRLSKST